MVSKHQGRELNDRACSGNKLYSKREKGRVGIGIHSLRHKAKALPARNYIVTALTNRNEGQLLPWFAEMTTP